MQPLEIYIGLPMPRRRDRPEGVAAAAQICPGRSWDENRMLTEDVEDGERDDGPPDDDADD